MKLANLDCQNASFEQLREKRRSDLQELLKFSSMVMSTASIEGSRAFGRYWIDREMEALMRSRSRLAVYGDSSKTKRQILSRMQETERFLGLLGLIIETLDYGYLIGNALSKSTEMLTMFTSLCNLYLSPHDNDTGLVESLRKRDLVFPDRNEPETFFCEASGIISGLFLINASLTSLEDRFIKYLRFVSEEAKSFVEAGVENEAAREIIKNSTFLPEEILRSKEIMRLFIEESIIRFVANPVNVMSDNGQQSAFYNKDFVVLLQDNNIVFFSSNINLIIKSLMFITHNLIERRFDSTKFRLNQCIKYENRDVIINSCKYHLTYNVESCDDCFEAVASRVFSIFPCVLFNESVDVEYDKLNSEFSGLKKVYSLTNKNLLHITEEQWSSYDEVLLLRACNSSLLDRDDKGEFTNPEVLMILEKEEKEREERIKHKFVKSKRLTAPIIK